MEDNRNYFQIEDNLRFFQIEDDINVFQMKGHLHILENVRQPLEKIMQPKTIKIKTRIVARLRVT